MSQNCLVHPSRPRRRRPWLLVIVPPLLLVAACSSSGSTSTQPPSASGAAPPSAQASSAPYVITSNVQAPGQHLYVPSGRYVALGDSFSSGEANKPYFPETDHGGPIQVADTCHRSMYDAYPEILAQLDPHPGVPVPDPADFVACSGAKTQSLFAYNADNVLEPPQVDRLNVTAVESNGQPGGPVGLVTMSMGGNDVGFGPIITSCLNAQPPCHTDQQTALTTKLHWIDGTYPGNAPAGPQCGTGCNAFQKCPPGSGCNPENLVQVYQTLRYLAPHARILVVGYPREFRPNITGSFPESCQHINWSDQNWANTHLTDALNNVIKANIKAANVGIEYVDTVPYFLAHEQYCRSGDPTDAFHGAYDPQLGTDYQGYFHPNVLGNQLLGKAVLHQLASPAPIGSYSSSSPSTRSASAQPTGNPTGAYGPEAPCNMPAFQKVLATLTNKNIQPFGLPECAGMYGMGPFIIGVGNLPVQYFFQRGPSGNWTYLFDNISNWPKVCSIPYPILFKLIKAEVVSCP
jgi:lysophospholipase L1-like esterase